MKKLNMKGITLISLMVTIIVLIILAGVTLNMLFGETGILVRAKTAKEENDKVTATEAINLKITTCQIHSYGENGKLPSLAYLAAFLQQDKETLGDIEYVEMKSKKTASLDETPYTSWDKIYTKLLAYPYEFEINSSLQLASIDGIPIASVPENDDDIIVTMTKAELDSYINSKVNALKEEIFSEYDANITNLQSTINELRTLVDSKTNQTNLQASINSYANRGVITDTTNLNDLKTPGLYSINASSYANTSRNFPENNVGGIMLVYSNEKNACMQIYYGYTGTSNYIHMWVRHYWLNTSTSQEYWSDWIPMHT